MKTSSWILGDGRLDAGLILFPGALALLLSAFLPETSTALSVAMLAAFAFVDSGHVYTTAWRTWLRPQERSSSAVYWAAPLAVAGGVFLWRSLRLPFLWSFVTYATIYHQIRQFHGFTRWYERLNGRMGRWSSWFLYALCGWPLFLFHLKPGAFTLMYDHDLFLAPHPGLFRAGLAAYAALVAAWLAFEAGLWRRGLREPNRFFSIAAPASFYGASLFLPSASRLLFVMVIAHGIPYFAAMSLSLRRLGPSSAPKWLPVPLVIVGTAVVFGSLEHLFEGHALGGLMGFGPWQNLAIGLYLTPLLCHYAFDARIWRSDHRDARLVYARA